jgi:tRNA threonylcarbamoyladenosine biosynthesis protein TsaE
MSTVKMLQINSTSSAHTEQLGRAIGSKLRGGETLELRSDLGGGKTTFVRGLAAGFGSADTVGSPTFTILRQYQAGDKTVYHFDFYRLNDPGLVANELAEVVGDPLAVVVVEWADVVSGVLPADAVTITIKSTGENERAFTIEYPETKGYLVEQNG